MIDTRAMGTTQASIRVGHLHAAWGRAKRALSRAVPILAGLAVVAASLMWLVAAMGLVPVLSGLWISGMLFSALIAWALVKA